MTSEMPEPLAARWQYGRIAPMPDAIPPGWELVRLTDVARLESGHTPSRKHPEYWDGALPWVSLHDSRGLDREEIMSTAQTIGELGLANSSARMLPAGTVVFSRTATVGKATILGREMATSQDFANYVCGPRIWNRYLLHLLRFLQPEWKRLMAGSTHNTIYMPVFENLQALLPLLAEQQKIAAILSSVDDAIEATQSVIDQLQIVKKAMMAELLTRGLPGRHTRFKMTEIGEVPEEWVVTRLDSVATVQTGIAKGKDIVGGVELPYLRVANVQDGFVDLREIKSIAVASHLVERFRLRSGDVLFTEGGDADKLGRGCVWLGQIDPCLHQNHVFAVRPDRTQLRPEFLAYWAATPRGKAYFLECAKQTTNLASINSSQLKGFPVPLPPIEIQDEVVSVISAIMDRLTAEGMCLDQLQATKFALMSVLLTGDVRVTPNAAT